MQNLPLGAKKKYIKKQTELSDHTSNPHSNY